MPPHPSPRSDPANAPIYLLVMAVGIISFVFGAVTASILYSMGGEKAVTVGVAGGLIMFALMVRVLLREIR